MLLQRPFSETPQHHQDESDREVCPDGVKVKLVMFQQLSEAAKLSEGQVYLPTLCATQTGLHGTPFLERFLGLGPLQLPSLVQHTQQGAPNVFPTTVFLPRPKSPPAGGSAGAILSACVPQRHPVRTTTDAVGGVPVVGSRTYTWAPWR